MTLGTLSLFRGLAEGLTGGVENYTGLPRRFLAPRPGLSSAACPAQAPWLLLAALAYWRAGPSHDARPRVFAIGHAPDGVTATRASRWHRRLFSSTSLSGALAGLAAIIYVAHLGQAKADAGTGYELTAITAVVLGGTSIFGGRGTSSAR